MSRFGFIGSLISFYCFTNKVSLNPFIIAHVYNYHSSIISNDSNQIKNPCTDGKCEDNDLNHQDEDEDVHVCGSCKSAFGNVGA